MAARSANQWVAIDPSADRLRRALALRRYHADFQSGHDVDRSVRAIVAQSWERSDAAGLDPAQHLPPIVMDEREIDERWSRHPLYSALPALRELLSDATSESGHMLVISDARGVLLWIEGHRRVIEATEQMHFVCGADWSEAGAGTNALGTAIAIDHPVQIFSAEHFSLAVHPWQCSGAPIHDPDSGELLGVVDLTGHLRTAHPHTLSLVTAAARLAEGFLREQSRRRDEQAREAYLARVAGHSEPTALIGRGGRVLMSIPHDWLPDAPLELAVDGDEVRLPDGRIALSEPLASGQARIVWAPVKRSARSTTSVYAELLGPTPVVTAAGRTATLSLRHAELICVLLLSPRGLTSEQLALELYGEYGKAVTARAEFSRLRRLLPDVLCARPYRLGDDVRADVLELRNLIAVGDVDSALSNYPAPLLVESEVPLVVELRETIDAEIRRAVMRSADRDLLARWCRSAAGEHDRPAAELLLSLLDADDYRRPAAHAHVSRLRQLYSA